MAVETKNSDRLPAHGGPHVRNLARYENGLTGPHAKSLITNLKFKLAINDVDPLILVVVEAARPTAPAGELKNTHRGDCVPCGHLTIVRFAAEFDTLIESVCPCGDAEAHKHLLILHFLWSFHLLNGFVDRFNQRARPREVLLQNFPMRLEGIEVFKIIPVQDLFDLL